MIISICFTVSCPALSLLNGRVTYESDSVGNGRYPVNTRSTFTCDDGYRMNGPSRRDCQPSGNWDQQTTTCTYGNERKCLLLQQNHLVSLFVISQIVSHLQQWNILLEGL